MPPPDYDPKDDHHVSTDPSTGETSVKDGTGKDITEELGYNELE